MPGVGINVAITGDATGLKGALGEAEQGVGKMGGALNALPMVAVAAGALAVGAAVVDMTKAAAEDRAEQEKLNQIYVQAGAATGDYTEAINAAIDAGADKAFSDSEVRAGLQDLVTSTGDAEEANKLLGPAMDIARLAGVSLEDASKALAKAHGGNDAALRKLIPGLEKGKTATDTIAEATEKAKGQADLYAESAEGMGKKGSQAFDEMTESIGEAFLPIMDELMPALTPVIDILGELIKELLPLLKPAVMLIVGALRIFINILKEIITVIKNVLDWIGDMVAKVQDAANFVGSIDLNPFAASAGGMAFGPAPEGRSARSGGGGGGGSTVNVNVQSADPTEVVRAIRRWSRANGGSGPFTRGLDRSTA